MLPEPQNSGYGAYNYNYYRHQTSGAKDSTNVYLDEFDAWDDEEDWEFPKALATPRSLVLPTSIG